MDLGLNRRATRLADALAGDAALLGVSATELPGGARLLDYGCGIGAENHKHVWIFRQNNNRV